MLAVQNCDLAQAALLGRVLCKSQYGAKSHSCVRKANVFLEKWSLLEKPVIGNQCSNPAHVVVIKARPFLDPEITQQIIVFRNSGCVELFPAVEDRVAYHWDGAGCGRGAMSGCAVTTEQR